jgi:Zn-dependent peptidase ImmA (M78 family)
VRHQVTVNELVRKAVALAKKTRLELEQVGFQISDYAAVVAHFDIQLEFGELPEGEDGSYSKDERKIILSNQVSSPERLNFSFCHELMHDRIEHDDDLLSLFGDAHIASGSEYETMERLCNAGAAEMLLPAEIIRGIMLGKGFSVSLIPQLCETHNASSVAAAFQMVNCVSHHCYLVIAENRLMQLNTELPLLNETSKKAPQEKLIIVYSGASSAAKYSIKRNQIIQNKLLYAALAGKNIIQGQAKIPFASGNGWDVNCEALYYRGRVFAFFNVGSPISNQQLRLFD